MTQWISHCQCILKLSQQVRLVSLFIDMGSKSLVMILLGNRMWIDSLRDKIMKNTEILIGYLHLCRLSLIGHTKGSY